MAVLNSVADLNALLQKKGLNPVENTSKFRLTPTTEEIKAYQKENQDPLHQTPIVSEDQLFIQQVIESVIQHYHLDQAPGFYGDDEALNAMQVRQGVVYQVLNQPQILFEFFKKACYEAQKMERLNRFNDYYVLAIEDAKAMLKNAK